EAANWTADAGSPAHRVPVAGDDVYFSGGAGGSDKDCTNFGLVAAGSGGGGPIGGEGGGIGGPGGMGSWPDVRSVHLAQDYAGTVTMSAPHVFETLEMTSPGAAVAQPWEPT